MPLCFVIMGFGEKTDFSTGRKLNLDKTYRNIIKPAITDAGYECIRADEVLHSGVIDIPMYEMLFSADLVVADLSTSNLNAAFELGVRHALRPKSTIIIAESQFKDPFDLNHIVVRSYTHLGPDIGFDEVMRMRGELKTLAIALSQPAAGVDSPVYTVMQDLSQPTRPAQKPAAAALPGQAPKPDDKETYAALWEIALNAKKDSDFGTAKSILQNIYAEQTTPGPDGQARPPRPRVVQELSLAIYKSGEAAAKTQGPKVAEAAYEKAAELLQLHLNPDTTNDPETLGLWSAIHKRRADLQGRTAAQQSADLDVAILAAERGFLIRTDYYTGTNLAFLLNVRASRSAGDDRITDNVLASRVRRKVVEICSARIAELEGESPAKKVEVTSTLDEERYWAKASLAESLVALGDDRGPSMLKTVLEKAPAKWMADATSGQLATLKTLLAKAKAP